MKRKFFLFPRDQPILDRVGISINQYCWSKLSLYLIKYRFEGNLNTLIRIFLSLFYRKEIMVVSCVERILSININEVKNKVKIINKVSTYPFKN